MRFAWALAGLAVVLGMLVMAGRWRFVERRERVYPTETAALAIPRDAASIERGRHVLHSATTQRSDEERDVRPG